MQANGQSSFSPGMVKSMPVLAEQTMSWALSSALVHMGSLLRKAPVFAVNQAFNVDLVAF